MDVLTVLFVIMGILIVIFVVLVVMLIRTRQCHHEWKQVNAIQEMSGTVWHPEDVYRCSLCGKLRVKNGCEAFGRPKSELESLISDDNDDVGLALDVVSDDTQSEVEEYVE